MLNCCNILYYCVLISLFHIIYGIFKKAKESGSHRITFDKYYEEMKSISLDSTH